MASTLRVNTGPNFISLPNMPLIIVNPVKTIYVSKHISEKRNNYCIKYIFSIKSK